MSNVLSLTSNNVGDDRDSFSHYYLPNVENIGNVPNIDFNVLIDDESFFDLPVTK